MKIESLTGLVAATFTPMKADGSLDLSRVPAVVDHLHRDGVSGLYVLGSTGEGVSLTTEERMVVAEAYVEAAKGRLPVVIQVGHNSLSDARALAEHAQDIGADAISAMPPEYFKPDTVELLIDALEVVTQGAPELPFYYYHIPVLTGVNLDMVEFLRIGSKRLPTLVGIKFSDRKLEELLACIEFDDGRFDILFGIDEMLLGGVAMGVRGAVGSTYNFAAPLYQRILFHVENGNMKLARRNQALAARMVKVIIEHCGRGGLKAMMALVGVDVGGHRLPLKTAAANDIDAMKKTLEEIGFFEWGRSSELVVSPEGQEML